MDNTSRRDILNEFESITEISKPNQTPTGNSSQGSNTKDIRVITKAMEKLVMDIQQLKAENATIRKELQDFKTIHVLLQDRMDELSHSVGADQNLHEWQVDASQESAIETGLSNKELIGKLTEYENRRRQFGMN